jgi:hypothetical protein
MDVIFRLRRRPSQRGSPPPTTAGLSLLLAASTSTTFLYDFLLRLASTACLYVLPLRASTCHRPSPVQVERLSFSLCDFICTSFSWNYFSFFLLLIVQLKDVLFYCC